MDSKPEDASQSGSVSVISDQIESVNVTNGVNSVNVGDSTINIDPIKDVDNSSGLKAVSDDETEGFSDAIESILDENTVVAVKETQLNADVDVGEDKDNDETFSEPMEFVTEKVDEVGDDAVKDKLGFVENSLNSSEIESNSNNSNGVVEDKEDLAGETASEVVVNGVRGNTEGDEEDDEDEDVLLVGGADDDDDGNPVVDASDVKVSSEGVSVVEGGDVGLSMPPVVSKVDDETPDTDSAGGNDVKVTSEGDSVVEAIDVDLPLPGAAGVAVVTKTEESGSDDVEVMDKSGLSEKMDPVLEEVVDKEVVGITEGKYSPLDVEVEDVEKEVDYAGQENGSVVVKTDVDDLENITGEAVADDADNSQENGSADKFVLEESAEKDDDDEQDPQSQMVDGQIVTDSDEEDDEEDGKELFDSAALAALLKAAADGSSEGGNITFSSQDGSRLFTVERPAGLGPSLQAMRAAPRPQRVNFLNPSGSTTVENEPNLSEEERKKLEKLQSIRVKFLRLVHRLGLTPDEPMAAQVLYRLALIAGRQTGQSFSLDAAKRKATELESDGNDDDLDFSLNILVMGKAGAGKSATINSIFGEEKTAVGAFQPGTDSVKEIRGVVGGVTFRVFDTPGLRASIMEQAYNRSVLSSAKKAMKKNPADVVLYVDRLDAQTRDLNDIPLLKTITSSLGSAIWRSAIVTFTHGASAPPEGSNGTPLSYEMFVTQRSHVVQQSIGQAVGDLRMMSPSLMNPVSLVENHQSCRKNREGQKVLPNGQTWRPQLLMLCYSIKILAEANALTKPQDPYDSRKLFGFRMRSPPLPYMLSSMLQSRPHPKLSADQGGDGGDSDVDLAELTDSDNEDEDEYDQLPPFKPLKKSQLAKLSKEQKKAYFDEYDYRVKLLQKKQWKEEVKRMKEMKKKGNDGLTGQSYQEEEGEGDAPASVAVPLPDMVLPPSFDSDNPAYRFRFLEPTSQFLARPVLDTHGWDHDCGYDGVNVEQSLAIANRFPAAVSVQVTKDKKDFSINMDSSIAAKHNEKASSMAGFDIQPIGKQLAYIVRGETKFKNLKGNKTAAGMSVTFLGENTVTGFKVEDQLTLGRQYSIIGSAGTVRFQTDSAYGANIEVQRRELDYPIGQIQSTVGLSIIKWRGDLALGFNSLAQFSAGRNSKVAVRAGINNKMSGQITVKTSSSEYLSLALAAVIPSVLAAYKKLRPDAGERY
ncbi:putative small monomeric GTPase [Helianthus annuus]|nr:putative small monomeric GTPase [Helianthus annuus]KAJ0647172.1 putative small monomeric GTPase [Helianthus annuus]KAJ0651085.1 putative small monomeric GTPase [Helianthus annuus]